MSIQTQNDADVWEHSLRPKMDDNENGKACNKPTYSKTFASSILKQPDHATNCKIVHINMNNSDFNNDNDDDSGKALLTRAGESVGEDQTVEHQNNKPAAENVMKGNRRTLLFKLTESPPLHFLIFFALQQCFLVLSTPLSTTVVVAEVVCAQNDDPLKIRLLCATCFMMGLSTFAMTTFGVRLPVFQGATATYILPLLMLKSLDEFKCPDTFYQLDPVDNSTRLMARLENDTVLPNRDISLARINAYAGSLILVGVIHLCIGAFGLVSIFARLVGPITIVPVVLLFGIYIHKVITSFVETHWPTALLTVITIVVLGFYLEHHDTPIPLWTPSKGFHIRRQPFHRIFALLFSIIIGWGACALLTVGGVFTEDETNREYLARTDARFGVIERTNWVIFPYPCQFGIPGFSMAAFIPFLTSCILSVLDSIGDYNATAKVTSTPPPPNYALNRGIAVEGLMSVLSGAFGCSHATVSFGENIGAIGISRVASRSVFQAVGFIYILFAILGKIGAFFITIPYSVIGGTMIITYGMLIGVILSYLEGVNLRSQRNLMILGITLLMGMVVPYWVKKNPYAIQTGMSEADNTIRMFLGNPSFVGGFLACFLDNTIPGTAEERGIAAQEAELQAGSEFQKRENRNRLMFDNTVDIYRLPWIPKSVRRSRLARMMPIFDTCK